MKKLILIIVLTVACGCSISKSMSSEEVYHYLKDYGCTFSKSDYAWDGRPDDYDVDIFCSDDDLCIKRTVYSAGGPFYDFFINEYHAWTPFDYSCSSEEKRAGSPTCIFVSDLNNWLKNHGLTRSQIKAVLDYYDVNYDK